MPMRTMHRVNGMMFQDLLRNEEEVRRMVEQSETCAKDISAFGATATVPIVPTEDMWGGLARDIVMWMRFSRPSEAALLKHLNSLGRSIPDWLRAECRDADHVPPKGSVAVWIYRAMLEVAPKPPVGQRASVLKKLCFTRDVMRRARMDGKSCLMSIWDQDLEGVEGAIEILSSDGGVEIRRHADPASGGKCPSVKAVDHRKSMSGDLGSPGRQAVDRQQATGAEVTARPSDPITMSDIRLMAGEGKLTPRDVLAAANAVLRMRGTRNDPPAHAVDNLSVPLADHDDIGRKVVAQPWAIQSAIVTIAAHCTVIKDKCEDGDLAAVRDLAGCISQDLLELANFYASQSPEGFVLVPCEPSNDIIKAGCVALDKPEAKEMMLSAMVAPGQKGIEIARTKMRIRWRAMIEAARSRR